jgi:hypothetical protein
VTPEQELVGVITQVFPSFQSVAQEEREARTEALGMFLAKGWSSGPERIRQAGVEITHAEVEELGFVASSVAQAGRGGTSFLVTVYDAVKDDARFGRIVLAVGALYVRSRPSSSGRLPAADAPSPSGRFQAVKPEPPASASGRFQAVNADDASGGRFTPRSSSSSGRYPVITDPRASSASGRVPQMGPDGNAARPTIEPPKKQTGAVPLIKKDELDDLDLAKPKARSTEPGERTRGFDVRMLADLEKTLKEGDKPKPAPPPKRTATVAIPALTEEELAIPPDPEEAKAPEVKPAAPDPAAASTATAEAPSKDPEPDAIMDKLLAEATTEPVKTAEKAKTRSGRIKTTTMHVKEFSLDTNDDWREMAQKEDISPEDASSEEELPKDPAQAALVKFDRTGDLDELAKAKQFFTETVAASPEGTARAFAQAGLARVELLGGNARGADQQAKVALDKDPGNPFAVEIIIRCQRGDGERSMLASGLARGRTLIAAGKGTEARRFVEKLTQEHPLCPQPWLLGAFVAKLGRDGPRFEECIAKAWELYPGKKNPDVLLGGTVDVDLAAILALQGRERFERLETAFLKKTVENIDAKENLVAGTYRLAVALARLAIVKGHHGRKTVRKAWMAIGSSLIGLQYYDAALEALGKAGALNPDGDEKKKLENERGLAGTMRRAFEKPGVKAQLTKYPCVGVSMISAVAREKLTVATKDKTEKQTEFFKASDEVAKVVACDQRVRDEVKKAAEVMSKADPIEPLELVDAEIGAVKLERARIAEVAAKGTDAKKTGIFSKIAGAASSAADKVASLAKDTQLKVREGMLNTRREEVVRKLGIVITKELRDHMWHSTQLRLFAKRASTLEAFVDYHAEEERQAKAELEGLAKSV